MMRYMINGVLCLATLGAFLLSTPEVDAQRRGGGSRGGASARYYGGPRYDYNRNYGWYGRPYSYYGYNRPYWNYGWYGWPNLYGFGYYPYRSYYYRDYYPQAYYYYPETYGSYPTTTYESNYPAVQATSTAHITVRVPDPNADVWFNGVATRQRGTDRVFETPALSGGNRHTYEIRARWMDTDGQMRDRTRTIEVQPGQDLVVDFG